MPQYSMSAADHSEPVFRNRSGETAGCGLDRLCAREVVRAGAAWPEGFGMIEVIFMFW